MLTRASDEGAVAVVGAGPAGLMAAEVIARAGLSVDIYDAMPSVGRKFLMAGKGGLNITHTDPSQLFNTRYGTRSDKLAPFLARFGADDVRAWIHGLGITTFVGTSGRVFPSEMKAAPLLRSWLRRLRDAGVRLHMRHRWQGWDDDGRLLFATPDHLHTVRPRATVLALGGGSWARLGSDGAWVGALAAQGVNVSPLVPSNCGFDVAWSAHFRIRYGGAPVKPVVATFEGHARQGEFVTTETGVEGGLIYALSIPLRSAIARDGVARLLLDLRPDKSVTALTRLLDRPRGRTSFATYLRKQAGLSGVKAGLVYEADVETVRDDPAVLAELIKKVPLTLSAPRPLDEAISSGGGVVFEDLDDALMVRARPGVFCAGEMLDWEAPTGGYLLTACLATGHAAGEGVVRWLAR